MKCIDEYIGISQSCEKVVPKSKLYIEDLPGVSLKYMALSESGKYITAKNLVAQKARIAAQLMIAEMNSLMLSNRITTALETINCPFFSDEVIFGAGSPGLQITKIQTQLSKLYLPRFYFKSSSDVVGLVITVSDGVSPVEFTVSSLAGEEKVIEAQYTSNQNKITITYPSEGVEAYGGSLGNLCNHCCNGCSDDCGSYYLEVKGIDQAGDVAATYFGIRADIELICDTEKMFCNTLEQNKVIFLYATGEQIMKEASLTDRVNFLALGAKEMFAGLAIEFGAKWRQLFMDTTQSTENYLRQLESGCFNCTSFQNGYSTP